MRRPQNLVVNFLAATAALLCAASVSAAPAGRVADLSGSLVAQKADGRKLALAVDSEVEEGDTLTTYDDSRASIRFRDGGTVLLKPASQFRIQEFGFVAEEPAKDNAVFALLKGGLRAVTGLVGKRRGNSYSMQAVTATIGIRGTDYGVRHCQGDCQGLTDTAGAQLADGTHVEVFDGKIVVFNEVGTTELRAGQFGFVRNRTTSPAPAGNGYHDPLDKVKAGDCVAK